MSYDLQAETILARVRIDVVRLSIDAMMERQHNAGIVNYLCGIQAILDDVCERLDKAINDDTE